MALINFLRGNSDLQDLFLDHAEGRLGRLGVVPFLEDVMARVEVAAEDCVVTSVVYRFFTAQVTGRAVSRDHSDRFENTAWEVLLPISQACRERTGRGEVEGAAAAVDAVAVSTVRERRQQDPRAATAQTRASSERRRRGEVEGAAAAVAEVAVPTIQRERPQNAGGAEELPLSVALRTNIALQEEVYAYVMSDSSKPPNDFIARIKATYRLSQSVLTICDNYRVLEKQIRNGVALPKSLLDPKRKRRRTRWRVLQPTAEMILARHAAPVAAAGSLPQSEGGGSVLAYVAGASKRHRGKCVVADRVVPWSEVEASAPTHARKRQCLGPPRAAACGSSSGQDFSVRECQFTVEAAKVEEGSEQFNLFMEKWQETRRHHSRTSNAETFYKAVNEMRSFMANPVSATRSHEIAKARFDLAQSF
ncbi:MAG: hypothetical protein SP1CHLAM54_00330 [Chlamydiia bacterium]|nr:hypothetical protein [Chlamydiia bacterium]MCH9614955.1 hypothetical protein [Chlamydiia bacterium]MCH9629995.1 hypothetical protein [Chlamydiia bacterium]